MLALEVLTADLSEESAFPTSQLTLGEYLHLLSAGDTGAQDKAGHQAGVP